MESAEQLEGQRLRGRIRRVKREHCYGFISGDDGVDYFFHKNGLQKASTKQFESLTEQDRLEFTVCKPARPDAGMRAIEVTYVEG